MIGKNRQKTSRLNSAQNQRGIVAWLLVLIIAVGGIFALGYIYRNDLAQTRMGKLLSLEPEKKAEKVIYYCPMHPQYQADKPGTCPICNMNLEKMPPELQSQASESGPSSGTKDAVELPPGTVKITPQKQQLIGVQYGEVKEENLTRTILTVGQLTYDETKITRIQSRTEGWIEKVFVDYTGKFIKEGQPLFSLYSPDLFSAQQELLVARAAMESLGKSEFAEIKAGAESLYQASRQRLRLWNIPEAEIQRIEKRGTPLRALTVFSPATGFVITKNAFPGQRVAADTELYTIADLSTVWALADLYQYEIPLVHSGQHATMTLSYFPGETFHGKVSFIYPTLDNTSRTLKVRLEFPNPQFRLKPEMYAQVAITVDYGKQMAIPVEAVLDAGTEQIVFVSSGDGYFEPRRVDLGARVDNRFIVLGGLKLGERIVTSGNFLIDSESKLKSALSGIGPLPGHSGHGAGESGRNHETSKNTSTPALDPSEYKHSSHN